MRTNNEFEGHNSLSLTLTIDVKVATTMLMAYCYL